MKFDAKCYALFYCQTSFLTKHWKIIFKKSGKDRTSVKIHYNFSNCLKNILLVSNNAEFYANYFVFKRLKRRIDSFTVKCKKVKKCSKI